MEGIHMLRYLLKIKQTGFEGCIVHHANVGKTLEISEVYMAGDPCRVCLPPIRPCLCPQGFSPKSSIHGGLVMTDGYQGNCLFRRPFDLG